MVPSHHVEHGWQLQKLDPSAELSLQDQDLDLEEVVSLWSFAVDAEQFARDTLTDQVVLEILDLLLFIHDSFVHFADHHLDEVCVGTGLPQCKLTDLVLRVLFNLGQALHSVQEHVQALINRLEGHVSDVLEFHRLNKDFCVFLIEFVKFKIELYANELR